MIITPDLVKPSLNSKPVIWKEFGAYIDKKITVTRGDPSISLTTSVAYKICNSCQRPIGTASLADHYLKCMEMRQRLKEETGETPVPAAAAATASKRKRGRPADDSSVESTRNSTPIPQSGSSSGNDRPKKKYKKSVAQREKEGKKKEARKKSTKPKPPAKDKGPVDVEKQCGVPLPSGGHCKRSLTCKTHSMGAKRAVPGRSAPYDVLLQQYQKRNQAKLAASNALAVQQRENQELRDDDVFTQRVLDPDEETHMVLEGLSKNTAYPLERHVIMPLRRRQKFLALREAYANALIISGNNQQQKSNGPDAGSTDQTLANQAISGSIGGLQGRCALINVDSPSESTQSYSSIPGEMYQVRAPSKAISLTAQYNQMQQQAFQQTLQRYQQQQQQLMQLRQQQQASSANANANANANQ